LFIAALFQATVAPAFDIGGVRPDFPLLIALSIAARIPVAGEWRWRSFWVGWIAGLWVDVFSPGAIPVFGVTAIVYGLAANWISRPGPEIFYDNIISKAILFGLACAAANAALMLLHLSVGGCTVHNAVTVVVRTSIYDAALAPIVYAAIRPLNKFVGVRERRTFANV